MAAPICACDTYNKSGYKNMCSTAGDKQVEIYRLQKENAALKEQITNAKYNYLGAMADCKQYEETIEQQAEAIRLKDAALDFIDSENASEEVIRRASTALAIQPSPDILQARDERVAGACVSVIEEVIASFGKRSLVGVTKTKICLQMVI